MIPTEQIKFKTIVLIQGSKLIVSIMNEGFEHN